jgi:hypothetical protein
MVRVLINGSETVNRPIGVDALSERYFYADELFAFLREITGNITFWGDDFEFFYNLFKTGQCNSVTVDIQEREGDNGAWINAWQGLIYLRDITFDADQRTCEAEIVDNSAIAKIQNYKEFPIELFQPTSKNGVTLTLPTSTTIDIVDLTNTTTSGIKAYTQFDVMDYLFAWVTDNEVGFQSAFLTSSPANKYYFITGQDMRKLITATRMTVTISEMIQDMCKMWNLRWAVAYISGRPTIVMEPAEYFEQSTYIQVDGFRDFKFSYNDKLDYGTFSFGSAKSVQNDYDSGDTYIKQIMTLPWAGHAKSSITPDGNCATKSELRLETSLIVYDCNAISDCLNNTTDANYDESLFICNDESDAWLGFMPNRPINNYDLFCVNQLKRWLKSYCFGYPSIVQCDSYYDTFQPFFFGGGFFMLPTNLINAGCYLDYAIFKEMNTVSIELYLELSADAIDNPSGGPGTLRFALQNQDIPFDPAIAPDTSNGWTSGPVHPNPEWVDYVERVFNVGDTAIYHGFMDNVHLDLVNIPPLFTLLQYNLSGGPLLQINLTPNSYIKVRSNAYSALRGVVCDTMAFKVDASGYIQPAQAEAIRTSPFGNLLLPNNFKNFSGPIVELERKLSNGETKLNINTKTI